MQNPLLDRLHSPRICYWECHRNPLLDGGRPRSLKEKGLVSDELLPHNRSRLHGCLSGGTADFGNFCDVFHWALLRRVVYSESLSGGYH